MSLLATVAVSPLNGWPGVYQDLQWRAQLCCALTSNGKVNGASSSVYNQSLSHVDRNLYQYQCCIQNITNTTEDSGISQAVPGNCIYCLSATAIKIQVCWTFHQFNSLTPLKLMNPQSQVQSLLRLLVRCTYYRTHCIGTGIMCYCSCRKQF